MSTPSMIVSPATHAVLRALADGKPVDEDTPGTSFALWFLRASGQALRFQDGATLAPTRVF